MELILEIKRKGDKNWMSIPTADKLTPETMRVTTLWFENNPKETVWHATPSVRVRRVDVLKQALAACYGAGEIKQAQIAGRYPPPPVPLPLTPGDRVEPTLCRGSGTITGRWTSNKPPFHELYGGKPVKLSEAGKKTLAEADYSALEQRVLAWWID